QEPWLLGCGDLYVIVYRVSGFHDTPLGIVKSFNGLITDMIVRVGAVAQLEGEGAPTLTLGLFVNGKEKESLTITGENTLRG
ncbi:hypothetical protein, partial [Neisseria sp. P0014.S006]|uniref:hypothetical protein n=1 Tax=Neisseria sp. P0014.S006 TaxID=3436752 RepID=UPI003F820135